MTVQFPPLAPSLPGDLPTPADAIRADGWTPARQRRFLETLAATGVIMLACESVRITTRSAYNLRTGLRPIFSPAPFAGRRK